MDKRTIIGSLITLVVAVSIGVILPLTLGLGTGSLGEVGDQIDFFQRFYVPSIVCIVAVMIILMLIRKNDSYGDGIGLFNLGKKPSLSFFGRFSGLQLTLLSVIFFSIIFFIANLSSIGSLTGFKFLPQQAFSKTQSLLFSSALIPVPENLLLLAVTSIFILGLVLVSIKYKLSTKEYFTYLYVGLFVVGAFFGVVWHNSAYPTSDNSKIVIAVFWGTGAVINVATGSFIPFWAIHVINNFFIDFKRLYSSDALLITVGLFILGLIVLYAYIYRNNLLGGGRREKEILA